MSMKQIWLFILLLLPGGGRTLAQSDITELYQKIEQQVASGNLSDTEMFQKYDSLMMYFYTKDMEKTQYYFQEGIAFAREKKNEKEEAKFLTSMGNIYCKTHVLDSGLIYLDKAWQLIEGKNYYEEEYRNYEARGAFYKEKSDYENAMDAFLKSREANEKDKAQKIANKQSIEKPLRADVHSLSNIAIIYSVMYNPDKAIEYLLKAIKIMDDNPDVNFGRTKYLILGNTADMYLSINRLEEAFPLIEEAYQLAAANEDLESMAYQLIRFVKFYFITGDLKKALNYGKQALQIAEKTHFPRIINVADKSLMQVFLSMKDYKSSLYHANRMLERTEEDDWYSLHNIYEHLAIIYAAMDHIEKANECMIKYREMMINISNKNMHDALQEMEVKYKVQQKEMELTRQQAEIGRQKAIRNISFISLAIALLIIGLMVYIVRLRNRHNRELAESNTMKDKFFRIISHDLKNPAISQRDAIHTLLENTGLWDTGTLKKYYQDLLYSADHQVDLLYNLLNWAHVQTGRMPFALRLFDLSACLRTDLALLQYMADFKNIRLNINLPEHVLVTGDSDMLTTVVRNLVTNAIKFTHNGGQVTLEISPCKDTTQHESTKYTVSVTDTGVGMNSEQIQNLFHFDHILSRTGTTCKQRIGLGMVVCREFLEKHGSRLSVESEEGKGSRFWFEV